MASRPAIAACGLLLAAGSRAKEARVPGGLVYVGPGVHVDSASHAAALGVSLSVQLEWPRFLIAAEARGLAVAGVGLSSYELKGAWIANDGVSAPYLGTGIGSVSGAATIFGEVGWLFRRDARWVHPQIFLEAHYGEARSGSIFPDQRLFWGGGLRLLL